MPKVTFVQPYDHKTPSGHLAFPAGWSGEVEPEIAEAARKAGRLETPSAPAKPAKG